MDERLLNDIELLAALFKEGGWQEIRVTSVGVNLLFSQDQSATLDGLEAAAQPAAAAAPAPAATVTLAAEVPAADIAPAAAQPMAVDPAWQAVVAPNLGTFYRSPKPGAPPFVEPGQKVTAQTEVCLIEVMKLFTSVTAGVSGTVVQICATDAQLVDGGQVLFYILQD